MKNYKKTAFFLAIITMLNNFNFTYANDIPENNLPAFPTAEGGGMYTLGARAGENIEIYHVTNLNDSGKGSFREAMSEGNRIIIFDVAGTIMLKSDIETKYKDNITILGQTSPGDGICVGGCSFRFENCNNIIVRYMRFRSGDTGGTQEDGLGVKNCKDVIIDHCSITWAIDETLSAYANRNFTAQYNIISESLNNSLHAKGAHGYGGIWGGENASFHHNLISTHKSRMPRIGTSETVRSYLNHPDTDGLIDIRNNVFYNWARECGYGGENGVRVNFINNYYKKGPSYYGNSANFFYLGSVSHTTVYAEGNVMENDKEITDDNYAGFSGSDKMESIHDGVEVDGILKPMDEFIYDYPITTETAEQAYADVLESAGANLVRDTIDTKIINDVINSTATNGSKGSRGLIDSQEDVGGWIYLYGEKQSDMDNDGIPDEWEDKHGLDKNDPIDALKIAASGYTNIEEYANDIVSVEKTTMDTNSTALRQAIFHADNFDWTSYYQDRLTETNEASGTAKFVLAAQETDKYDEAAKRINEILSSLETRYKTVLQSYINSIELSSSDVYLPEQWENFTALLNKAKSDLEKDEDNELLKQDYEELKSNYESLETAQNLPKLKKLIENSRTRLDDIYTYTEKTLDELAETIVQTEEVLSSSGLTSRKVDELYSELAEKYILAEKVRYDYIDTYSELMENGLLCGDLFNDSELEKLKGLHTELLEMRPLIFRDNDAFYDIQDRILKAVANLDYESKKKYLYKQDFENELPTTQTNNYTSEKYAGNTFALINGKTTINTNFKVYNDKDIYYSSKISGELMQYQDFTVFKLGFEDGELNINGKKGGFNISHSYSHGGSFKGVSEGYLYDPSAWNDISVNYDPETREARLYINYKYVLSYNVPQNMGDITTFYFGTDYAENQKLDDISIYTFENETLIYGDASGDGVIAADDAAIVLQKTLVSTYQMPVQNQTNDWLKYTDVSGDGTIAADDSAIILQKALVSTFQMPVEADK